MRYLVFILILAACRTPEPTFIADAPILAPPIFVPLESKYLDDAMDYFPCGLFTDDPKKAMTFIEVRYEQIDKPLRTRMEYPPVLLVDDSFSWVDSPTKEMLLVGHELGHIVGLDHDPAVRPLPSKSDSFYQGQQVSGQMFVSLMVPNVGDHANRLDWGFTLPRLSSADEEALEERYCK